MHRVCTSSLMRCTPASPRHTPRMRCVGHALSSSRSQSSPLGQLQRWTATRGTPCSQISQISQISQTQSRPGSWTGVCATTPPFSEGERGQGEANVEATKSLKRAARQSNQEVYDKLIDVFHKKKSSPEDWKKLIVYSAQWPTLAPGVFARLDQLADENYGDDPDGQLELRRFKRRLEGVSQSMAGHFALLEEFRGSSSAEWEGLVAARRKLMGARIFRVHRASDTGDVGCRRAAIRGQGGRWRWRWWWRWWWRRGRRRAARGGRGSTRASGG